jgi:HSP90 family molecular chaperone
MRKTTFKVHPKLAALLGENYRSSEFALRELVDNAWDAEARNVWIVLPSILTEDAIIEFRDDGSGMTPEEVRSEYLIIANNNTLLGYRLPKCRIQVRDAFAYVAAVNQ